MNEPFKRFEWPVAAAYHWQDWLDPEGKPVVVRRLGWPSYRSIAAVERMWRDQHAKKQLTGPVLGPVLDAGLARSYSPMSHEHATLFLTFAKLDYTDLGSMLQFANSYGLLGLEEQQQNIPVPGRTGPEGFHYASGESQLDWAREICLMREALHLTRSKAAWELERERADWQLVGLDAPDEENQQKLNWLFNRHLQGVQPRMAFALGRTPKLSLAPLTLLAAMWLQLALAVVGDKEFRNCKFCRRLFEISTDRQTGYHNHREFCTGSCKTKDYRKRKRTALTLQKKGNSLTTIAEQTGTNKATVRAWVTQAKRERKG